MKLCTSLWVLLAGTVWCMAGEVTVTIKKIHQPVGQVVVEFYQEADAFLNRQNPALSITTDAFTDGQAQVTTALEPGRYAISVWHDENQNGLMDFNDYRQPLEGWGVSKNARGFPGFEEVAVTVTDAPAKHQVSVRYPRKVVFQVEGLRNTKGKLLVGIYDNSDDFLEPGKALTGAGNIPIDDASVTFEFMLQRGSYAATVVHDENGNGELDKNLFGSPKEGFGFSTKGPDRSPVPSFGDASFFVGGSQAGEQVIRIRY